MFRFIALSLLSIVSFSHYAQAQAASEVHAVGLYHGGTPRSAAYRAAVKRHLARCQKECDWGGGWDRIYRQFPFHTTVTVSRVGVPVTLVLTAHDKTIWNIQKAPGAVIDRIVLGGGYGAQIIKKNKAVTNVPVVKGSFSFYTDDREQPVSYPVQEGGTLKCKEPKPGSEIPSDSPIPSGYQETLDYLAGLKLKLTSAQGAYEAEKIEITDRSSLADLKKQRRAGYCYRNADGSLREGTD